MITNFNDISKVRHVQAQDPVSAIVTSQPTRALERRIQALEQKNVADSVSTTNTRLVIPGVPIFAGAIGGVLLQDVVFYNRNTGLYEKALAGVTLTSGVFSSNPSALAFGIVVAVNGTKADVMVGGYDTWVDDAHKTEMLENGESFLAGTPLYLSAKEPGKLTRFPPSLRIQVMIATDANYVLVPSFSSPESVENIYRIPIGMRPVGSLRTVGSDFSKNIVVGFDALENYDVPNSLWRLSQYGAVTNHQNFGYMVADAVVTTQPVNPVYVRVQITNTTGAIKVFSANTFAELSDTSGTRFNQVTTLVALQSNAATVRTYQVQDQTGNTLGTISFKFTDPDVTLDRHVFFKFPDSFQGWKMISAPITPLATATIAAGGVAAITVVEGSIGYETAPTVVITGGGGTGATAVALLNEFGTITSVTITAAGTSYTSAPTITFVNTITSVQVLNGGSGATATTTLSSGVIISSTVTAGGTGYLTAPQINVVDSAGNGSGAILTAQILNGAVVGVTVINGGTNYTTPVLRIAPSGNQGYQATTAATFTVVMSGATVGSVTVVDGGHNYPQGPVVVFSGGTPAVAATASVTVVNGVITAVTMLTHGSGYGSTPLLIVSQYDMYVSLAGSTPNAVGPVRAGMVIESVDVLSSGADYDPGTTVTLGAVSGATGGTIRPIISGGRIVRVDVINPGANYSTQPSVTFAGAVNGNNAVIRINLGTTVTSAVIGVPANYDTIPNPIVVVPLQSIVVSDGGSGYSGTPTVTIGASEDPQGITAAGTAVMGGKITRVIITAGGTGYTAPNSDTITITPVSGGTGAILQPMFTGGILTDVAIINPGTGFGAAPTLAITVGSGGGSGATLTCEVSGADTVAAINLTSQGIGYRTAPIVTIAPPGTPTGTQARAFAVLAGAMAVLRPTMSGTGGLRSNQASSLTTGNNLQITDFHDDMDDGSVAFSQPKQAALYYNFKADPALAARYPAVPIDKASFMMNGVELLTAALNEGTGLLTDIDSDIGLTRKTLLWTTFDLDGSPWDRSYTELVLDVGTGGRDQIIQNTGPAGLSDLWWRFWEHVFKYENDRNRGWLHINVASRFYQSGKVASLSVLAPLRIANIATGVDSNNDGTPQTGQLLITIDDQVNIFGGTGQQISLTTTNALVVIYQNNTGQMVIVSSVILVVTYQLNQTGLIPTADNNAQVTVGTQEGSYRDLIGSTDADVANTRLFAVNQAKELFPDADSAGVMLAPNQQLFLRVSNPAGGPILSQIAVARVKGHTF